MQEQNLFMPPDSRKKYLHLVLSMVLFVINKTTMTITVIRL